MFNNWAAEESQFEFVIAIICVVITMLHAYIINPNEQLSGKVPAVPRMCIKSLKTWDCPLRALHILFTFVLDKEKKTLNLKFLFTQLKCDIVIEVMSYCYRLNYYTLVNLNL